jgi:hypothetical protein
MTRLRCWLRGVHGEPVRQSLGGFRCLDCGFPTDEHPEGYVDPDRMVFRRDRTQPPRLEVVPLRGVVRLDRRRSA